MNFMEVESVILSAAERFSSPMHFDWVHDFMRDRTKKVELPSHTLFRSIIHYAIMLT